QGRTVHGTTARLPGVPPRPLRRVQPDLRPRHPFRTENGRAGGVDPDVFTPRGALGVRLPPRARLARGGTVRVPPAARLGVGGRRGNKLRKLPAGGERVGPG